jgi:hypothetical protein
VFLNSLFRPVDVRWLMLLAITGIFIILALLGFAAFLVAKEQLSSMRREDEVLGRPLPKAHSH